MVWISFCELKARGQMENIILDVVIMKRSKLIIFKMIKLLLDSVFAFIWSPFYMLSQSCFILSFFYFKAQKEL